RRGALPARAGPRPRSPLRSARVRRRSSRSRPRRAAPRSGSSPPRAPGPGCSARTGARRATRGRRSGAGAAWPNLCALWHPGHSNLRSSEVRVITMTSHTIGLGFFLTDSPSAIDLVERAERAGVDTAWLVMPPLGRDTTTVAAAALARTERIRVGTSIDPAYTRHSLNLAAQAITLDESAPGRFRLGTGTGNLGVMANGFGTPITRPTARTREYVDLVRTAIATGEVRRAGEFHTVDAALPHPAPVEVSLAALGPRMFETAGAVADAAMSWNAPLSYLDAVARPAIARGAAAAGRPVPKIITHLNVLGTADRAEHLAAGRTALLPFTANPQYAAMFATAGFPVGEDG